MHDQLSPLSIL